MPHCEPSPSRRSNAGTSVGVRDDEDLADAREHQHRQRVVDHRLVVDGQQLLRRGERDRMQTRAGAAGEDDAFHHGLQPRALVGSSVAQSVERLHAATQSIRAYISHVLTGSVSANLHFARAFASPFSNPSISASTRDFVYAFSDSGDLSFHALRTDAGHQSCEAAPDVESGRDKERGATGSPCRRHNALVCDRRACASPGRLRARWKPGTCGAPGGGNVETSFSGDQARRLMSVSSLMRKKSSSNSPTSSNRSRR